MKARNVKWKPSDRVLGSPSDAVLKWQRTWNGAGPGRKSATNRRDAWWIMESRLHVKTCTDVDTDMDTDMDVDKRAPRRGLASKGPPARAAA